MVFTNNKNISGNNSEKRQVNKPTNKGKKTSTSPRVVLMKFCQELSFSGFQYIANGVNFFERLCWIAATIASAIIAGIFVSSAWENFSKSPTVVKVETTNYPLNKIPFPAVTICPANFIKRKTADNLLGQYLRHYISKKYSSFHVLAFLSKLQYPFYYRVKIHIDRKPIMLRQLDYLKVSDFMLKVFPTCKEVFAACAWQGRLIDCCKAFAIQRTESGFCYSFNSLTTDRTKNCTSTDDFIIEDENKATDENDVCVLRHNQASGTTTGLEVFLATRDMQDSLRGGQVDPNGVRVIVHHPTTPPDYGSSLYMQDDKDNSFSVKVSPSVTFASSDLRSMSISTRKCYFPDEIKSQHLSKYSHEGCLIECRLNWIMEKCGCYPYFFDIKKKGIREYTMQELKCLVLENTNIRAAVNIKSFKFKPNAEVPVFNCTQCLPTCHDSGLLLDYNVHPTSMKHVKNASGHLDVYYKDPGVIKYRRESSFTIMELIVSFGGILGLFLGISVFISFELIFYFIMLLRAVYNKLRGKTSIHNKIQDSVTKYSTKNMKEFSDFDRF